MNRLTSKNEKGAYSILADAMCSESSGYTGPAIDALAGYENMQEAIEELHRQAAEKIDALKAEGKLKTSTAQQLLAQKLTYANMLGLIETYKVSSE